MNDAYLDALSWLYGRLNYERLGMPGSAGELRLGRMRRLLKALDDPQNALRIVHVTGTKGKGSTASLISSALTASGLRTGLFTSPHLHRLEERFVVDGELMQSRELVELLGRVMPAVERVDGDIRHPMERLLTFFEITTAMGLVYFAEQGADAAVLEVGLGGRLDSTNVVRPRVSVITSISFDHTRLLGSTLESIAREKAGIVKRGGLAVVGTRGRGGTSRDCSGGGTEAGSCAMDRRRLQRDLPGARRAAAKADRGLCQCADLAA